MCTRNQVEGTKAKELGRGFKLYYYGVDETKNGVGIVLESELVDKVVEVNRVSERLMWAKLITKVGVVIIVSVYAPQMGCEEGIIYTTCIRPAMLYGSETWPTKIEDIRKIQRSEMRMLRWMTGVSLSERKSNECVRSMLAIDDIAEVMRRNRLRWFGHVERRDELCWLKRIETLQIDGDGVKGRPRKRWREVLKVDMREKGLCREDVWDRSRWRRMLWLGHRRG